MADNAVCELWCLVKREDTPFSIAAPPNININKLKELVWEKRKNGVLRGIDAVDLVLWKLDNPIPIKPRRDLPSRIRSLGDELAEPTDRVLEIFPHPLENHLHIVVELPLTTQAESQSQLNLNCLILGDPYIRTFSIKIAKSDNVSALRRAIKEEKRPAFQHIDADALVLWKADIAVDKSIAEEDYAEEHSLSPVDKLSKVFSDQRIDEHIHIIVRAPQIPGLATAEKRPLSSPHPEEPSLKLRRTNYFGTFPNTPLTQPSEFSNIQKDPATLIFCNRPRTANSTPITLLDPIFGEFVDDCKSCPLTPELASFSLELATEMCKFYDKEADRSQVFRYLIWQRLRIKLNVAKVEGTGFEMNGHASAGFYAYVNTECKNKIGSTLADPYLQSAIYYHHYTKYVVDIVQNSRFPCLHLYYFGSHLGFAGSAFSDRVHYEPLTSLIPLCFSPHDTDMLDTITRFFGAFQNAASKLETYYKNLLASTSTTSPTFPTDSAARFPYPTTFTRLDNNVKTSFKLEHQPLPDKLLYIGRTEAGVRVVVKFVRSYSRALHEHCASLACAPLLLGLESLAGGWSMVVMEFMNDYKTLSDLKDRASISTRLRPMVTTLVDSFHAKNLVHGDIRDSNLLVLVRQDQLEMKLVDFDWGGLENEVHYPIIINNLTISRPPNVVGGQTITKDHDLWMVRRMFQ